MTRDWTWRKCERRVEKRGQGRWEILSSVAVEMKSTTKRPKVIVQCERCICAPCSCSIHLKMPCASGECEMATWQRAQGHWKEEVAAKTKWFGVFQPTPDLCVHAHKPMNEKMVDHRLLKPSLALFRWTGPIILAGSAKNEGKLRLWWQLTDEP